VDFINQGMLFAATLLVCFFPFLIVGNALAGRSATASLARHAGLNRQAAADVGHLFAPAATTSSAVTGTASVVFFVLGGTAAATALQQLYERIFELDSRGMKNIGRRIIWLALLGGAALLGGWAGPALHHAAGAVLLAIAALAHATAFWWLTLWILVGGRVSWQKLFPSACATGAFYVGMVAVFSLFFSSTVISENEYGPIGTVFALMTFLIAIGVVIILGAVTGLVWQERGLSSAAAFRKLRLAP
jgi:membrane protein